ncbi:glycogen synthase GlgA [Mangrovicoccus sp. HB182678]|uniref:Glycogen synthase n=2 Tax=Mangrovicoccus algicola TaxID=2771008 RepID=A0A8J6Z5P8_9RHOB|nr:glycogen synthase GlgA [Mangrovicoccus algicola]
MGEFRGRVLSVASECVPLVKSGGLADVTGALPGALAAQEWQMAVLLPGYRGLAARIARPAEVMRIDDLFGGPARILSGRAEGSEAWILLLEAPHLYDRPGGPYLDETGQDHSDNPERFGALCLAAALIARDGLADGWRPDLVHAHDWQGGLVPAYLRMHAPGTASVLTIHNIAFQGLAPASRLHPLRLDPRDFYPGGPLEFHGQIGALKAGLVMADRVTTVSPRYAAELALPEFGMGLEGVIAALPDPVAGILNGIDKAAWDPARDPAIRPYSARAKKGRAANRALLFGEYGLEDGHGPVLGIVSRMTRQKGLDLVPGVVAPLLERGLRLAVLGSGDAELERAFEALAAAHPGKVGLKQGYDEALSHRIYAGADALLVPSRFEPCGLTQLYALRYGAVPVVAPTGGLSDTVIPASPAALGAGVATGVMLPRVDAGGLSLALSQLCDLYEDPAAWRRIQANGMAADFGWDRSAAAYAALYHGLTGGAD